MKSSFDIIKSMDKEIDSSSASCGALLIGDLFLSEKALKLSESMNSLIRL